jgi:hypothetical protein
MSSEAAELAALIFREHRHLDDLLGQSLAAFGSAGTGAAAAAIAAFDEALRRHTALEDERLLGQTPGGKLVAPEGESERDRLRRELALEHVQIRELSGIIRRLLADEADPEGARRLLPGLMRRWESHTAREEGSLDALGAR